MSKTFYYVQRWNDIEKFIATNSSSCEILQMNKGKLTSFKFNKPYPETEAGNMTQITREQYNKVKELVEP